MKGFLKSLLNSYLLDFDSWVDSWNKDKNAVASMIRIPAKNSAYSQCVSLIKPKSKVLSCGCGPGREVKMLTSKKCIVTAIDRDKGMLENSKQQEKNAEYILGDMLNFKRENYFDVIACLFNTINYLKNKEERKKFVELSYINLKNKGILIINTYNISSSPKLLLRFFLLGHPYYFLPSQIRYWFRDTKFKLKLMKFGREIVVVAKK